MSECRRGDSGGVGKWACLDSPRRETVPLPRSGDPTEMVEPEDQAATEDPCEGDCFQHFVSPFKGAYRPIAYGLEEKVGIGRNFLEIVSGERDRAGVDRFFGKFSAEPSFLSVEPASRHRRLEAPILQSPVARRQRPLTRSFAH